MPSDAAKWAARQLGKVAIWLVFVVGFSLLPLFLVYNNKKIAGEVFAVDTLLADGELLLVVTAVSSDSLERFVSKIFFPKRSRRFNVWELILFLVSLVFIILSSLEYASLLTRLSLGGSVNAAYVVTQSKAFFWSTLLTGAGVLMTIEE